MKLRFVPVKEMSSWRRLALANWGPPNNPTVFTAIKFKARPILEFLAHANAQAQTKITATHLMAKAAALILERRPDLNRILRWGRLYQRTSIDIFLQVNMDQVGQDDKPDLSGAKIEHANQKTLTEIAAELIHKCKNIRSDNDPQFKKTKLLLNRIPILLLRPMLKLMEFLAFDLCWHLPKLGLAADPFGSAMVTSIGSLGLPSAFVPLLPMSRCPLIVCVGAIRDEVVAENGQVKVEPMLDVSFSFDHRFADGLVASRMLGDLRTLLAEPEKHLTI